MILNGDALEQLKLLNTSSIDFICTDPPYGYSFMGKHWDKAVPSMQLWMECLRVLKPGGFINVMSAPRSDVLSRMIVNIEDAGFRVDFTPIYWTYASGFPKAGNIGKLVDKRLGAERIDVKHPGFTPFGEGTPSCPECGKSRGSQLSNCRCGDTKSTAITDEAKALDGSYAGFQPKPAVEVIIVAMKPLSEKSFVDQALANGRGISWLDDGRIPTETSEQELMKNRSGQGAGTVYGGGKSWKDMPTTEMPQGRFPANLLVSDDVLNDGTTYKSGARKGANRINSMENSVSIGDGWQHTGGKSEASHGSYSRYFNLDKWAQTLPFLIVPKASKGEKNKGLDGLEPKLSPSMEGVDRYKSRIENGVATNPKAPIAKSNNHHPTVKPLKLMSYLITLFSREGDTVLDPFVGSGTTCVAAHKLVRKYIGIELEFEYAEIAEARLAELTRQGALL